MESDESSAKRRRLEGSPGRTVYTTGPADGREGSSAYSGIPDPLFAMLDLRTIKRLGQVNRAWRQSVAEQTVADRVTGLRTIGELQFWTTDPVDAPKRYFKPMDAFGNVAEAPHVSEQHDFPSHVTDVVPMHWPDPGSHLPGGHYPSKVQYQRIGPGRSPRSYRLGPIDLPTNPRRGRVYAPAPPQAREPEGTYIEIQSMNRATRPPLPETYPRLHPTPAMWTRSLSASKAQFEHSEVHQFDKR